VEITSGGEVGTNGGRIAWPVIIAMVGAISLAVAVVNALSRLNELYRAGISVQLWEPWVWEMTSAVFWIAICLPLTAIARRLRPPALPWPGTVAALIALSVPVCAIHLAWFAFSRGIIYAALGSIYRFDWEILYEWRKDILSVLVFAAIAYVLDYWSLTRENVRQPSDASPLYRLEVRDGAQVHWVAPDDIECVEAAGNYVELRTANGPILHRATLASVEAELAPHGFLRIHRSRLIRRNSVTTITTARSGDFNAKLTSGAVVAGSRRYRTRLGAESSTG
jgi:LytTr DNA-binding domain